MMTFAEIGLAVALRAAFEEFLWDTGTVLETTFTREAFLAHRAAPLFC